MNTTDYISSGILEQYVAGLVSPQEKQEVECMSHIYPEIKLELVSIQQAIEALAKAEEVTPPAFLRDKILGSLSELAKEEKPVEQKAKVVEIASISSSETTKPSNPSILHKSSSQVWRVAASILFLITSGLGIYLAVTMSKTKTLESNLVSTKSELEQQKNNVNLQKQELAVVTNPNFKPVKLNGIPTKSPESNAIIYWNASSQEVYITVAHLPKPASDKQYQLWAIADGKPVDMGMIAQENLADVFQKMKTISNPQAFAITLEKKGGVPSPTMTEMYVMGGI